MSRLLNILAVAALLLLLTLWAMAGDDERRHPVACRFDCGEPR